MFKIKKKSTGNCACKMCGKVQVGLKMQPYTLWHMSPFEKRGHNEPMCSLECCKKFIVLFGSELGKDMDNIL